MLRWLLAFSIPLGACAVVAACDNGTFYDEIDPTVEAGADGALTGPVDDASLQAADRFCLHADAGLCADFDGPNIGEWSDPNNEVSPATVPNGADLEVGDGPTAKDLVATLPAGGDVAVVAKDFIHAGTEAFRAEADVNIPRPAAAWVDQPVGILGLVYGTNAFTATAQVRGVDATDGALQLYVQGTTTTVGGAVTVPYDTWFHVTLTANPAAGTAQLTSSLGANVVASNRGPAPTLTPAQVNVFVGLTRTAPTVTPTALILQADNLVGILMP